MNDGPRFTTDLAGLPTHAFSYRSLTWWGIIGFMVIEGTAFVLTIAAYFFLMSHEAEWAPQPWNPPDLLAGTLFTIVILLSEIPNTMIKKAAEAYDVARSGELFPVLVGIGFVLLVIRGFEFNSLNVCGTTMPTARSSGRCCCSIRRTSPPTGWIRSCCGC